MHDINICERQVYRGLPQGSSLSPLLFNIYFISLIQLPRASKSLFYADDVVFHEDRDLQTAMDQLNTSLDCMNQKISGLYLSLAPAKCQTMIFTNRPFNTSLL